MTASQQALLDQLVEACEAAGVPWRPGVDMPDILFQVYVPADRFAAVRSRMRCRIEVVWSGGIGRALLYHPDDAGEPAIRVALLEDSSFESLDRSYHFSNKQLEAFSRIHILREANVRWLVTDPARWPLEVAVPASRFGTLVLPDVPGVTFVPMEDGTLHRALFDHSLAQFQMVGAACDAKGVDWVATSTQAMVVHGLPEWPDSNGRSALVSDLCFVHEKLPLPPGVNKALFRSGGSGQVMFAYPAFAFVYFWQWSVNGWGDVLPHKVVRNGVKVVPVEMLLADALARSAPPPVMDAFAARRDDIDWPLADLFADRHGSGTRAALKAFRND